MSLFVCRLIRTKYREVKELFFNNIVILHEIFVLNSLENSYTVTAFKDFEMTLNEKKN